MKYRITGRDAKKHNAAIPIRIGKQINTIAKQTGAGSLAKKSKNILPSGTAY